MARSAARIAAIGAAICVFFLLTLSLWNLAAAKWQHERNPVPGNFYTVEGLQMHIDCSGTGSPPVVLEAAASAPWSQWRKAQPELSRITQVCSYDRAGHGSRCALISSNPVSGQRQAPVGLGDLNLTNERTLARHLSSRAPKSEDAHCS